MVESLIVILIICLLLFSLLQLAQAFAYREVLEHASARAARARTVGFNGWMCKKVMRVAAIPNAGKMIEPSGASFPDVGLHEAVRTKTVGELIDWSLTAAPPVARAELEAARIPEYLASEHEDRAAYILDYENWNDISASGLGGGAGRELHSDGELGVSLHQTMPLDLTVQALIDWFGALSPADKRDHIVVGGNSAIEDHYSLYLDDKGY